MDPVENTQLIKMHRFIDPMDAYHYAERHLHTSAL